jgi:hypothetical protein
MSATYTLSEIVEEPYDVPVSIEGVYNAMYEEDVYSPSGINALHENPGLQHSSNEDESEVSDTENDSQPNYSSLEQSSLLTESVEVHSGGPSNQPGSQAPGARQVYGFNPGLLANRALRTRSVPVTSGSAVTRGNSQPSFALPRILSSTSVIFTM